MMTHTDFDAWLTRRNLTERAAAKLLGVAPATVGDWRRGISRYTGRPARLSPLLPLACAAIDAGLAPVGEPLEIRKKSAASA